MNDKIVAINNISTYDENKLYEIIKQHFLDIGVTYEDINNKKIAIKPNLVVARAPDKAATTHPIILKTVVKILNEYSPKKIILAESSGGPYTELSLKAIYNSTGMTSTANEIGLKLNYDTSFSAVNYPNGKKCHSFDIINPILDADVIINLCKLKSHSLMKLSCATKNFFGVIPGVEKFAMHAKYPNVEDFAEFLIDLNSYLSENKKIISICDGILAMEGNGPSLGVPRKINCILTSSSTYSLDLVAEYIIGFDNSILTTIAAQNRNLCPNKIDELTIIGDDISKIRVEDFLPPDSKSGKLLKNLPSILGGKAAKFFEPRPVINKEKCVGCGQCIKSCPMSTISFKEYKGKKVAKIGTKKCIRCYCCQELCLKGAVDTKQNILIRIIQ